MKLSEMLNFDVKGTTEELSYFIKNSVERFNGKGIIIGLSGGLDSACVCDPKSEEDAIIVANQYGVRTKTINITPVLEAFRIYDILPQKIFSRRDKVAKLVKIGYSLFPKTHSPFIGGFKGTKFGFQRRLQAYYRIKHRVRMAYLYYYGEQLNYLVAGTSNRTEFLTGFFVKHGDGAADLMPIINLYKTQVRKLSEFIGVPKCIIEKAPIPDLIPGLEDENVMGISYEKLDLILAGLTNDKSVQEIIAEMDISGKTVKYVENIIDLSEGLRSPPKSPNA